MKKTALLLVGYRSKACEAAQKLGFDIFLWDEKRLPKSKVKYFKKIFTFPFKDEDLNLPQNFVQQLKKENISFVSGVTEKAVMPAVLARKALGFPGTTLEVAKRCRNKITMKNYAQKKNILVTPFVALKKNTTVEELEKNLSYPIVLKYKSLSGRRGLLIAHNKKNLGSMAKKRDLAEKWIKGKEFSVESFIRNGKIIFKNITEYYELGHLNIMPASLNPAQAKLIYKLNDEVIKKFKINQGMTHLECYLTKDGLVFGEIALRPPGGYLMDLIHIVYGFDPWAALLSIESGKKFTIKTQPIRTTCSWIFHPGPGKIKEIKGLDEVKKIKEVSELKIKLKVGDVIGVRESSSEEYGHIIIQTQNQKKLLNTIKKIKAKFKIIKESAGHGIPFRSKLLCNFAFRPALPRHQHSWYRLDPCFESIAL